ncbi:MAG TPA: riboflavin synthase [Actinomycetota bacterium]|nr:riboflavin synthase [Actinomycetota bacterium]
MFTGLVTDLGRVKKAKRRKGTLDLTITSQSITRELKRGDSVAVNGVCLTASDLSRRSFRTVLMDETLARTTLGSLQEGSSVNLELAARLNDRIGGHLVQGHVDGVAEVIRAERGEGTTRLWLTAPDEILRYVVPKGSITLDGVSLTVAAAGRTSFEVALIPHTLDVTTLDGLREGSLVNVETDVMAKYVERFVVKQSERD